MGAHAVRKKGQKSDVGAMMREHHERRTPNVRKVGFYGCADQVIRLGIRRRPKTYPRRVRLKCPGCGHEHDVSPSWRPWVRKLDEGKEVTWVRP